MLYLKPANFEDIEKECAFVAAEPATYVVSDEYVSDEYVTSNKIKVIIPKEVRKEFNLPKTAWIFGGELKPVSDVNE